MDEEEERDEKRESQDRERGGEEWVGKIDHGERERERVISGQLAVK